MNQVILSLLEQIQSINGYDMDITQTNDLITYKDIEGEQSTIITYPTSIYLLFNDQLISIAKFIDILTGGDPELFENC